MEKGDFKRFVEGLREQASISEGDDDSFDRDGLAAFRSKVKKKL